MCPWNVKRGLILTTKPLNIILLRLTTAPLGKGVNGYLRIGRFLVECHALNNKDKLLQVQTLPLNTFKGIICFNDFSKGRG